jgi:hypothetical protein
MKTKTTFIAVLAAATLTAGVGTAVILNKAQPTNAADVTEVGDLAAFKAIFDGGAGGNAKNIKLTADIDYGGGDAVGLRMAGTYTGTFDGNGHTISNIKLSQSLFNLVTGTVKDLTFNVTSTGSGFGGLAYAADSGSTFTNVTVNATFGAALNNWGPIAFWSKGTISNCKANITIPTAYAGANTLFHMARADSGSSFSNDVYTVTGTGSFLADPAGVSEAVNVSAVSVAAAEVAVGNSAALTATLTGNIYDHIKWVVADTTKATVASATTTTNTVSLSGVAAGSTTVTAYVYADAAEATLLATSTAAAITVTNSTPVSAIALDQTSLSLKNGTNGALNATLTGNTYTSIAWASANTSIATVSGSGLAATVTSVAEGGPVNVTVTVVSTAGTFTASCAVTVTAPAGFTIYFLDQQADNTTHSSANVFIYNPGDIDNAAATQVKANSNAVKFRFADPADSAVKNWIVWSYFVNTTVHPSVTTGSYIQLSFNGVGRWGAGMNIGTITEDIFCVAPAVGSAAPTKLGSNWTTANFNAALDYASNDAIYSGNWRNSDDICYVLNNATTYAKIVTNGYEQLAAGPKAIVDVINDSTTAYTATLGETIAMLQARHAAGSGTAYSAGTLETADYLPWILISVAGIVAIGGFFFLAKKKHARA